MSLIDSWRERRARSCLDDLRIESLRYRELLQNARRLLDLLADGEEKSRGDYIIDMHYVTSLVDQTIERAGRMVFDACVLAAGAGEVLFPCLDEQKKTADAFHRASQDRKAGPPIAENPCDDVEPEYRLLNQVVQWFRRSPETGGGRRPLVGLMQAGFDQVMAQPRLRDIPESYLPRLRLPGHEVGVVLPEDHPRIARKRDVSLAELNCRPLGLMAEGREVEGTRREQGPKENQKWLAVVREDYLSLRSRSRPIEDALRVEAMASGQVDSDFVFVYAGCRHDLHHKMPVDWRIEDTSRGGRLGWAYDVATKEFEETLIRVGRAVFE